MGKTEVCLELARILRARGESPVAVSADALQVYRGLDTLTAKPSAAHLAELEHRLVSIVPVTDEFSVGRFAELAHAEIDRLVKEGRMAIVVGGAGLYLRAALADLALKPAPYPGLRERWERHYRERGAAETHAELSRRDPDAAVAIHPNDRKRVVRALELAEMGRLESRAESQLWSRQARHPTLLVGLIMHRQALRRRIDGRVDEMIAGGVVDEARQALQEGVSVTAAKALGLAELAAHVEGRLTLAEATERIKRRTRRYARRQVTWMRKLPGVLVIDRTDLDGRRVAARIAGNLDLREPASG